MTGVGFWAGWSVGSSDDAQAGLAALRVAFSGIPLAGVVLVGESVLIRRSVVPDPKSPVMPDERVGLPERLVGPCQRGNGGTHREKGERGLVTSGYLLVDIASGPRRSCWYR